MDQDTITKLSRRGIREPSTVRISDTEITAMTLLGVYHFGMVIKEHDPAYYNQRKSIASNTHIFDWPSDCLTPLNVWDMMTNAKTITGAVTASGLVRLTSAAHGFADDDIVQVHDVAGTTEANGIWVVDNSATDTFDLYGSTFANTYSSGGKVFEVVRNPPKIRKIILDDATNSNSRVWYPRGKTIVVDDPSYTYDIILDYIKAPTAITDIPTEYHMGLVAWNVVNLIMIPSPDDRDFSDKVGSKKLHTDMMNLIKNDITLSFQVAQEGDSFVDDLNLDDYT